MDIKAQQPNTDWVKSFIHNIFSGNSAKAEGYMAEKMEYINLPLYKYCYVCEESKRQSDTIDYNIRAFRGELGTNDPAEASALELLKAML